MLFNLKSRTSSKADRKWLLRCCLCARFGLLGDDLIFDLVVSALRNDFLLHQVALGAVRPALDDFLRISIADTRQDFELLLGGSVYVEFVFPRSGLGNWRRS